MDRMSVDFDRDSTVIVIPHDIDGDPVVIVGGRAERSTYGTVKLMDAVREAERRRLAGAHGRTLARLRGAVSSGRKAGA